MEEPGAGRSGDMPYTGGVPALQADGMCVEETVANHLPSNWVTGKELI